MEGFMTRTMAREAAVRLCFSAELTENWGASQAVDFFDSEYYATLCEEDDLFRKEPDAAQLAYIGTLFEAVAEHKDEADAYISKYAKGYDFSRIYKTDLAALYVACYELLYTDTPRAVIVNEAVELSKSYSDTQSYSFVNGILASVIKGELDGSDN